MFSKHTDWEDNFIKNGYAEGKIKEDITLEGLFGKSTFDDGIPVMKCWDRENGVTEMEIEVPKGQRVIIEQDRFIWIQLLNGWLCVDLDDIYKDLEDIVE